MQLAGKSDNDNEEKDEERTRLETELASAFPLLMAWLWRQKDLKPEDLKTEQVQQFIRTHAAVLDHAVDTAIKETPLDEISVQRLKESNYVFSGIKTFHELKEAFPSLVDADGNIKPFEQFLTEVRRVHKTYNRQYLQAEYHLAQSSASMAARWKKFEKDGDRYLLQYRTIGDKRVRPTHRDLHGITLPINSKFWDEYFPPNNWNCRCSVVQVRRSKYTQSDEAEAMRLGLKATAGKYREMFLFNPGKTMTCFPMYNAYTRKACIGCKKKPGNLELSYVYNDELCRACGAIKEMLCKNNCTPDKEFGDRLLVHDRSDQKEIIDNTRCAKSLLQSFEDMKIVIREHVLIDFTKNPEYYINGILADRKGIEGENGVTDGFKKAKNQFCKIVVLDLDAHPEKFPILRTKKLSKSIENRRMDFINKEILQCYVVFNGKSVLIDRSLFIDNKNTRDDIMHILEKIEGDRSHP